MISHPRQLFGGWCLTLVLCFFSVQAQAIKINAPDTKDVVPGEFVTLMFQLEAPTGTQVEAIAESKLGWVLLRQPGNLEFKNTIKLVPVTVTIPIDAPAGSVDTITLSLASGVRASSQIKVKEQRGLELQAPANLILGKEKLIALIENTGNVEDQVVLELSYGGEVLESRALVIRAQTQDEQIFEVQNEGLHVLKLSNQQGIELSKAVTVIRFGVPEPEPLALLGQWENSLDKDLEWQSSLVFGGSLSDFWTLDGLIEAPYPRRSFLEFESSPWGVRFGEAERKPFGVSFLPPVGLSVRNSKEGASILASLGWMRERQFAFYLIEAYESQEAKVSVGAGISAGEMIGAARYSFRSLDSDTSLQVAYADRALDVSLETKTFDAPGELEGSIELLQLGTDTASVQFRTSYYIESLLMYASWVTPMGVKATQDWNVGLSTFITANVPGELGFGIQWGNFGGSANLRYFHKLDQGWFASHEVGWVSDQDGSGWSVGTHWSVLQEMSFSAGAQMTLYQDAPLKLSVEADLEIPFSENLESFAEARWTTTDQSIGLNAGVFWQTDPWGLEFSGDIAYDYGDSLQPISFDVRLKGIYNFSIPTPEHITQDFGGRNTGLLSGIVQGDGIPISDVVLEIDRYKLLTDAEGKFSAELPPGDYTLKLDKSTLPITFRLITAEEVSLTIPLQREIQVDFDTVVTAALSGQVLLDADGDGKADEPAKAAEAQFVLEDAEGLKRVIKTNPEGRFLVRGLLPGKSTLKLTSLPLGSQVVGASEQALVFQAGQINEVLFVVQPPTTLSQDFSEVDLRIRRVKLEVEQVPSGTAPLVQVSIQGEPEQVLLQTDNDVIELSLKDKVWEGRLPIPLNVEGVYSFLVIAKQGQGEVSKKAQLIIDPNVPAFELELSSPVKPGENLVLDLRTFFEAAEFKIDNELGLRFDLQGDNGVYRAEVEIPQGTPDKIYPFNIEVVSSLGAIFKQEATFRVLVVE